MAILGVGIDVVDIARFGESLSRTPGLAERLFTSAELSRPLASLAARFAAKEAVLKAMGVGLWKFPLREIEVVRAESGAPSVLLHGRAAEVAAERGVREWRLTLTHTASVAQAIAVAL